MKRAIGLLLAGLSICVAQGIVLAAGEGGSGGGGYWSGSGFGATNGGDGQAGADGSGGGGANGAAGVGGSGGENGVTIFDIKGDDEEAEARGLDGFAGGDATAGGMEAAAVRTAATGVVGAAAEEGAEGARVSPSAARTPLRRVPRVPLLSEGTARRAGTERTAATEETPLRQAPERAVTAGAAATLDSEEAEALPSLCMTTARRTVRPRVQPDPTVPGGSAGREV